MSDYKCPRCGEGKNLGIARTATPQAPYPHCFLPKRNQEAKAGALNELAKEIHENAIKHGWWDKPKFHALLTHLHSEVTEIYKEYEDNHPINETYYSEDEQGNFKPEGVPSEIADVIILTLSICQHYDIDIEQVINEKMAYNKTRPYKHGGKVI